MKSRLSGEDEDSDIQDQVEIQPRDVLASLTTGIKMKICYLAS